MALVSEIDGSDPDIFALMLRVSALEFSCFVDRKLFKYEGDLLTSLHQKSGLKLIKVGDFIRV